MDKPYDGRYFYVESGVRRWIVSREDADFYNIDISQVVWGTPDEISKFPVGASIVAYPEKLENAFGFMQARVFLAKDFKGKGIEFGGDTNCHPLPFGCEVYYADIFQDEEEGKNGMNYGGGSRDVPPIKYLTDISDMKGIEDQSIDFIVHNHVIEHTRDPIKSLFTAHRKLKKNGVLLFAVPDKQVTFDVKRETTSLKHLVADFKSPSKLRDCVNIIDYLVNTHMVGYKDIFRFLQGIDKYTHFHTFTAESFADILKWTDTEGLVWSNTEIFPRLGFQGANEFYVRLTK